MLRSFLIVLLYLCVPELVWAERIGDMGETSLGSSATFFQPKRSRCALRIDGLHFVRDQLRVTWQFYRCPEDGAIWRHAVTCSVARVALGFMWNMSKDPLAIFIGATLAGLIGGALVTLIVQTTRSEGRHSFGAGGLSFAVGTCLLTRIQKISTGNKGGLDDFSWAGGCHGEE